MTFQSSSFYVILQLLAPCFTTPSFQNFATISVGLILCRDRHYISQAVRVCVSQGVLQHFSDLASDLAALLISRSLYFTARA